MATTLYLMSPETSPENPHDPPEPRSEPVKSKTRKNPKSNGPGSCSQKKQPQRGLGVAQLERLRVQEQREKIKEANRHVQSSQFKYALPFVDHHNACSAMARFGYGGAALNEAQASLQCVLQGYRLGSGLRTPFSDQICVDRSFCLAVNDGRFQNHTGELSSNQSVQCLSDQCEVCVKKKRSMRDFLGLVSWNNNITKNNDRNNIGFVEDKINEVRSDRKMEIIERIGVGEGKGKSVAETQLMEYDFFPVKGGNSNSNSSGSNVTRAKGGDSPPQLLDLSLKLSSF